MIGSDLHHCILTLVERKSGFVIIKKMPSRTAAAATLAALDAIEEHQRNFKTITFDNGTEFHGYKALEQQFPITCYFATPYHSWERGLNENTNGLVRQYFPKGTSFATISSEEVERVQHLLNSRPRKTLGFKSPNEVFSAVKSPPI